MMSNFLSLSRSFSLLLCNKTILSLLLPPFTKLFETFYKLSLYHKQYERNKSYSLNEKSKRERKAKVFSLLCKKKNPITPSSSLFLILRRCFRVSTLIFSSNGSYPFVLGFPWLLGHLQVRSFRCFSPAFCSARS